MMYEIRDTDRTKIIKQSKLAETINSFERKGFKVIKGIPIDDKMMQIWIRQKKNESYRTVRKVYNCEQDGL